MLTGCRSRVSQLSFSAAPGDGDTGGSFAGAYSAVDAALTRCGYPRFYDDPKPHASVAYVPGDVEAELRYQVAELVEAIKLCFDATSGGIATRCSRVVCEVSGAPGVTVWARAEGELPPPDV